MSRAAGVGRSELVPRAPAPRAPTEAEPPNGPPWDSAIADAPFALLDLEMTGLDTKVDRVIEICIERQRYGVIEKRIETLVDPGPSARFHTDVHGIDDAMLRGAPAFSDIADDVLALCEGAIVVAHGADWDVAFLEAELAKLDRRVESFRHYLDTLTLARRALLADSHALAALATMLGLTEGGRHRAGSDVRVLSQLFARLLDELRPKTPRDLWQVRVGQRRVRPEVLTTCTQLALTGEVAEICYRPSRKPARQIVAVVRQVRTDLDPPRVMGYALPDRGRFDLRADRILWAVARPSPNPDTKAP